MGRLLMAKMMKEERMANRIEEVSHRSQTTRWLATQSELLHG